MSEAKCPPTTNAEWQLFSTLMACQIGCPYSVPDPTDYAVCSATDCVNESLACLSGGISGDGTCPELFACFGSNNTTCSGEEMAACNRACFQAASVEAWYAMWNVQLCLLSECGTDADESCVSAAQTGACAESVSTCMTQL